MYERKGYVHRSDGNIFLPVTDTGIVWKVLTYHDHILHDIITQQQNPQHKITHSFILSIPSLECHKQHSVLIRAEDAEHRVKLPSNLNQPTKLLWTSAFESTTLYNNVLNYNKMDNSPRYRPPPLSVDKVSMSLKYLMFTLLFLQGCPLIRLLQV